MISFTRPYVLHEGYSESCHNSPADELIIRLGRTDICNTTIIESTVNRIMIRYCMRVIDFCGNVQIFHHTWRTGVERYPIWVWQTKYLQNTLPIRILMRSTRRWGGGYGIGMYTDALRKCHLGKTISH